MKRLILGARLAVSAAAFGTVILGALPAAAEPHCVVMQFLDAKGVAITTAAPIVGMLVGDRPVYEGSVPVASSIKPGAEAPCPQNLIDGVRSTFESACLSEQRRTQAATEHKVERTVIDKGCTDMMKALGSASAAK